MMNMTDFRAFCGALAATMLVFAMPAAPQNSAPALVDPFGPDAASMSKEDLALMRQSIERVLMENRAGTTAEWKGRKNAGRSTLRLTFTRDDMPCGEVVHEFTAGSGHRYVLPFCETKGGQWKLAF